MQYFKNAELARRFHVHMTTVAKWIDSAKVGRLGLVLVERQGRTYIANTAKNIATIEKLVDERRKFRNSLWAKSVTPRNEFYRLYNQAQIYDIVRNLDIHREIPRQYNYFDGGADNWDGYAKRLAVEETPNLLTGAIELLADNQGYLDRILSGVKRVNIVDIGVGNALPVKPLLKFFLERGILGRYIGLDISAKMLATAERNIEEWFGGQVEFEGYEIDMSYDRFTNILAQEYLKDDVGDTANLILLLGGTLSNLRKPDVTLNTIHDSMGRNDFLIYSMKLDSPASRGYFDFNPEPSKSTLSPNHRFIFDLLNIDESFYDVEMGFDEKERARYIRVRFKVALTIRFEFEEGRRTLKFDRGETILLWRSWQMTAQDIADQFERNDFYMLQASQTKNREYMLAIAQIKFE